MAGWGEYAWGDQRWGGGDAPATPGAAPRDAVWGEPGWGEFGWGDGKAAAKPKQRDDDGGQRYQSDDRPTPRYEAAPGRLESLRAMRAWMAARAGGVSHRSPLMKLWEGAGT